MRAAEDINADILLEAEIRKFLNTTIMGCNIEILDTVDSTNLYLKRLNYSTLNEGHLVIAYGQTAGRGRSSKSFSSPKGEGIYMTFLLKPSFDANTRFITVVSAAAVCLAIEEVCGICVSVKWVNDIFFNNKKLCGILAESVVSPNSEIAPVFVGIGINLGYIPEEIAGIATSIFNITGKRGYRNRLIAEVLNRFEALYFNLSKSDVRQRILREYADRLFIMNKAVCVRDVNSEYEAIVTGVGEMGELIVQTEEGQIVKVISGEIQIKQGGGG